MELRYKGYVLTGTPDEMMDFLMMDGMTKREPILHPEEPKPAKKRQIDCGKARALRAAGWSYDKIGEELKVSGVTVAAHLKKMEGNG